MRNISILIFAIGTVLVAGIVRAQPIDDASDAVVEIERQRLVKFPEDVAETNQNDTASNKDKNDEAKRILEEIDKINKALGYVKKQPEPAKIPPILDSSQYLFPNPPYSPYHMHSHQTSGQHGETILLPSIRSVKLDSRFIDQSGIGGYNVPPQTKEPVATLRGYQSQQQQESFPVEKHYTQRKNQQAEGQAEASSSPDQRKTTQFYYRPNQVTVPAPQTTNEKQQLPTHFVIPVRLYKLNKDEYVQKYAPEEYRVKGYKIVGDIDHFYGKAKSKNKTNKSKSTPKYHLFFLPRELATQEQSTVSQKTPNGISVSAERPSPSVSAQDSNSREEKLSNRPYKVQTVLSASNNAGHGSNNAAAITANSTTQIIRKRIVPKPQREKDTKVETLISGTTATPSTVHITPPAPVLNGNRQGQGQGQGSIGQSSSIVTPNTNGFGIFSGLTKPNNPSTLGAFSAIANNNTNNTAPNAIKTAFQNIFKFPFRQEARPGSIVSGTMGGGNLDPVPLQVPQKVVFASQPQLPQPMYIGSDQQSANDDYRWEDEGVNGSYNSGGVAGAGGANDDDDDDDSSPEEQKHIFGHRHKEQQATQKEAIKQGGIIIQKLKVRKGGIAIAGPGGVATAGSGGTAIVGPGGYALTHPRSLTIAGPGAKVIAIPSSVDLKDALQRTDLRAKSFPDEGRIVATGPTVYYSPATGSDTDTETGTGSGADSGASHAWGWQTTSIHQWPAGHANAVNAALLVRQSLGQLELLTSEVQRSPQPFYVSNAPLFHAPALVTAARAEHYGQHLPKPADRDSAGKAPAESRMRDIEPTTARPSITFTDEQSAKMEYFESSSPRTGLSFRDDVTLLAAVRKVNPSYIIEDIVAVPGQHILSTTSSEPLQPATTKGINRALLTSASVGHRLSAAAKLKHSKSSTATAPMVKVEATGKTSTSGSIPQIPFGTYFLPYLARQGASISSNKIAALILEPHSKAVVGNGGTAISTPISKAFLKKGVPTNVYFNPESVAIAGVGGKAHAQADLELNLVDSRRRR